MPPTVTASGLRFAYGDIVALSGLDLDIPSGLIGLVGANGAGKTTLLKLLLGILSPAAGKVEVLGRPMPERTLEVRSRVGYMP
ncbi:MAG: ATP-binding cassette domain-containing protein, partial [Actinobacteria bacterium]|nr:ATP-binding cassette domain-containing protein [Actinomycetota bacterium]